jgi:hypothetical protein
MSPVTVTAAICEALDAERAKNPGADLARAKELVIQTMERLAWDALRMDTDDMHRVQEPAYEVRHG